VKLTTRSWNSRVMGTETRLLVVTGDPETGDEALACAVEDLDNTEQTLSRFRVHSELSRLNRSGTAVAGGRLLSTARTAIRAYEWSGGLLDPRVISPLERFGYREALPDGNVQEAGPEEPLAPVNDMASWIEEPAHGNRRMSWSRMERTFPSPDKPISMKTHNPV
jgi:hypothetical protein